MSVRLHAGRLPALALALTLGSTGAVVALTAGPAAADPPQPVLLRAFTGGPLVQLLWTPGGSGPDARYRIYRDGTEVATVDRTDDTLTPTNRFTDRTAPIGTAVTYRVSALDAAGVESAPSEPVTVTRPAATDTTAPPTVRIDDSAPADVRDDLAPFTTLIAEWYPQFADFLARPAYEPPDTVVLTTGDLTDLHAAATVTGNTITYDLAWLREPGTAAGRTGTTLHEMVHVIQAGYSCTNCSWLAETVAVWATHSLYTDAPPVVVPASTDYYLDAYSHGEPLLNWVVSNYHRPAFVRDLNIAAHLGTPSDIDAVFVAQTTVGGTAGKTPHELWVELARATGVPEPARQSLRLTGSGSPGQCVEVAWADPALPPAAATCWDTGHQELLRLPVGGGYGLYESLSFWGRCLDLPTGSTAPGTAVLWRDCDKGDRPARQQWAPRSDRTLRNLLTGLCLEAGTAPAGDPGHRPLTVARCTGSAAQRWTADPR